mgnify:CR=1 FL=1
MNSGMIPKRPSLVEEAVSVMRRRLAAGEWTGQLPGERRLAELLQVGRDTVRLTLVELEAEGWLEPANTGTRRKIRMKPPVVSPRQRSLKVGILSPRRLELLSQPMLLEIDVIRQSLAQKDIALEVHAPLWFEARHPEARLAEFITAEACSAWLLIRSPAAVQNWFVRNRVPCLVRGYPHLNVDLPYLDVDWEATARHAAATLWRLGHQRVGVIVPPDRLRGVDAAVRGATGLGEPGFLAQELREDGTVEGVSRMFTRVMAMKDRPTALIATRPRQIATVLGCAARAGIAIPGRLSLIALAREPFLEYLVPEISGYRVDPNATAKLVTRRLGQIMAGKASPAGNPWIVPDVVKGGSIAKPG